MLNIEYATANIYIFDSVSSFIKMKPLNYVFIKIIFNSNLIFHAVHAALVNCSGRVKHVNVSIYNNLNFFFKIGDPATSSITLVDVSTSTPNATPSSEYSKTFYMIQDNTLTSFTTTTIMLRCEQKAIFFHLMLVFWFCITVVACNLVTIYWNDNHYNLNKDWRFVTIL